MRMHAASRRRWSASGIHTLDKDEQQETRAAANEEAADKSEKETEKSLQRLKKLQTQKFAIEGTGIDLKRFTSGMAI